MNIIALKTKFPCCGKKSLIRAIDEVPREVYTRRCWQCETKWSVERTTLKNENGVRVDMLTWSEDGRP